MLECLLHLRHWWIQQLMDTGWLIFVCDSLPNIALLCCLPPQYRAGGWKFLFLFRFTVISFDNVVHHVNKCFCNQPNYCPPLICIFFLHSSHTVSWPLYTRMYKNDETLCMVSRSPYSLVLSAQHCGLSVQFSCSVVPDSLWPHGPGFFVTPGSHARLPCPSPEVTEVFPILGNSL